MLAAACVALATTGVATAQTEPLPPMIPGPRIQVLAGDVEANTSIPPLELGAVGEPGTRAAVSAPLTFGFGFPEDAKPAVRAAVNLWAGMISSSQPVTVLVRWTTLGQGSLAAAGPISLFRDFPNAPVAGTYFAGPLAEALSGQNLGGDDFDISIDVNTRSDWYFGTDGNPDSGRYDLMTVVLHEIAHGLGFLGTMAASGSQGTWGLGSPPRPDIYDRFTEDASGQKLLNYANSSSALGGALRSGAVYFNSSFTNRGTADRVELYAPNPWLTGSSYGHLDEDSYPPGSANSLVTPYLDRVEAVHQPGPLALCILEALGWSTVANCVPPQPTTQKGFTWNTRGSRFASGGSGSLVRATALGLTPDHGYRLVSGLDAGADRPCAWDVVPINNAVLYADFFGSVGTASGTINRSPGPWQVCFREVTSGATAEAAAPFIFTVT